MSDVTPIWSIPYIEGTDIGDTIDEIDEAKALRIEELLTPFDAGLRASRPTSTPGSPGVAGRTYRSTDDGGVDLDYGTGWLTIRPGLFAALPGSPDTNQEILLQTAGMATEGVGPWRLRHDAGLAGTYKWKAIGADPISDNGGGVAITSSSAWDIAGPGFILPLAGVYIIEYGGLMSTDTGTAGPRLGYRVDFDDPTSDRHIAVRNLVGLHDAQVSDVNTDTITDPGTFIGIAGWKSSGDLSLDTTYLKATPVQLG